MHARQRDAFFRHRFCKFDRELMLRYLDLELSSNQYPSQIGAFAFSAGSVTCKRIADTRPKIVASADNYDAPLVVVVVVVVLVVPGGGLGDQGGRYYPMTLCIRVLIVL